MTGQYETHTPANLIQLPVQSEWLRRSPSKFLDGEAAQVSLCNIANTPLTHYTVTCANRTVQAILRNIFASVYGAYSFSNTWFHCYYNKSSQAWYIGYIDSFTRFSLSYSHLFIVIPLIFYLFYGVFKFIFILLL